MKRKKNYVIVSLLIVYLYFNIVTHVYAENGDPVGFNVKAVTPTTQIDLNKTYFYIKTEPDKPQVLEVNVTNNRDEEIVVETTVANAITGPNGQISYVSGMEDKDKTLQDSIEELVDIEPKELPLKANETKPVRITVNPPSNHYEGIKLGTIFFQKKSGEDTENDAQVQSKYRYAIDLVLSENSDPVYGGKSLKLDKVEPTLLRKEKVIALDFSNEDPKIIQDLNIKAKVSRLSDGKILKSASLENGRMAPNSHFTFEIPWGIDSFKPGQYKVQVKADSNTDNWDFEKEFSISDEQATKMNNETISKLRLSSWIYVLFGVNLIGGLVVTIYINYRRKKWIEINRKKRKKK